MSADETGWLIEGDGPCWWNGAGYTGDSLKAIRYARREDAERQIDEWRPAREDGTPLPADYLRPTEHVWTAPPDHVAAMEAQTGDDHPADDPRLHEEAAAASGAPVPCRDCGGASYLASGMTFNLADGSWVDWPGSGPRCALCFQAWQPRNAAGMAIAELEARSGSLTAERLAAIASSSEPPILPAPPRRFITRARLEELVEGAFRFDDIHVTAYRVAPHVVKKLGFEIVEEG